MEIRAQYDYLWHQALAGFEQGIFALDELLDAPSDQRYGITLLTRPDQQIKDRIQIFLDALKEIAPEQYYYPASDMHVTIMSIISCHEGFHLENIHPDHYIELIRETLAAIPPFRIHFSGITASPACILIQGFPESEALNQYRDKLRKIFRKSNLEQSMDRRYPIRTAHSTVVRFRHPVAKRQAFIQKLMEYRDHDFGTFEVDKAELVFNDWYQKREKVKTLAAFHLRTEG